MAQPQTRKGPQRLEPQRRTAQSPSDDELVPHRRATPRTRDSSMPHPVRRCVRLRCVCERSILPAWGPEQPVKAPSGSCCVSVGGRALPYPLFPPLLCPSFAPPKTKTCRKPSSTEGPWLAQHIRAQHTKNANLSACCTVKQATETMGGGHFVKSGMVGMSGIFPAVAGMMVGMGAIYHAVRNMKVSCTPSA